MTRKLELHADRLFPAEPGVRALARELYREVAGLPIVSPHGHTDPAWFARNEPFGNASELLLQPDHYVLRMLYSQGVPMADLIGEEADPRAAWRLFAERYHLFHGTPSRIWLDWVFSAAFGIDVRLGADIPMRTEYVHALKPLLDRFGNAAGFTLILFTLDESAYARELAPLAGHYPCLRLGPAWWFHDSPEGMRRFRRMTTETAGFFNTVGFNDDTRAFLSIPARHDLARRIDCGFLAELVAEHRLELDEAHEVARALAYDLAKAAYRL